VIARQVTRKDKFVCLFVSTSNPAFSLHQLIQLPFPLASPLVQQHHHHDHQQRQPKNRAQKITIP
jgi:hypothetical protein